jgi:hypothetical protein
LQTFLPYADFLMSAKVLDPKRLGNQCYRETVTLIRGKWPNHPASKMWRGYEFALARYGMALALELQLRGSPSGSKWFDWFADVLLELPDTGPPPWLGNEHFHASHRSNLLRKDPEWYGKFGWKEPNNLPYVWPV